MTFGQQNSEAEGHEQMNYAVEKGVNFFDTAEMYSIPGRKETQGNSEKIIGSWLKDKKREDMVIATKVTGPMPYFNYLRPNLGFSKDVILEAVDLSLERLQTSYIDVYQLHWPERNVNFFGQRNYVHNPDEQWKDNFHDVIQTLDSLVKAGKIRHYGVSNETSWGLMKQLNESKSSGFTTCKTIQNPYSLLNRTFEINLAEVSMREQVGLLAYSPLGFGALTGKYLNGQLPEKSRLKLFPNYARYTNPQAVRLTEAYAELAKKHNMSLTQMSLAFVNQRPFVTSNIIGATTIEQLKENIASIDITLSEALLNEIDAIQDLQPNPAP